MIDIHAAFSPGEKVIINPHKKSNADLDDVCGVIVAIIYTGYGSVKYQIHIVEREKSEIIILEEAELKSLEE